MEAAPGAEGPEGKKLLSGGASESAEDAETRGNSGGGPSSATIARNNQNLAEIGAIGGSAPASDSVIAGAYEKVKTDDPDEDEERASQADSSTQQVHLPSSASETE